jgi:hypothetical protein
MFAKPYPFEIKRNWRIIELRKKELKKKRKKE